MLRLMVYAEHSCMQSKRNVSTRYCASPDSHAVCGLDMPFERYNLALYWIPIGGVIVLFAAYLLLSRIPKLAGEKRQSAMVWMLCIFYFILMIPVLRLSNLIEARSQVCIKNLETIHQAKENWALENVKAPTDLPTEIDLFGQDNFIEQNFHCPLEGKYSINPIGEAPACTIPEHNRMFKAF